MLWVVLLAALIVLSYTHVTRKLNYWKKKNVHHERPIPIFGNFLEVALRRKPLGHMLKDIYDKLDDNVPYFGIFLFHSPNLVLKSVDVIKKVLIKDFSSFPNRTKYTNTKVDPFSENLFSLKNDIWKFTRNKLSPVFTSGKMKLMLPLMREVSNDLEKILNDLDGQEVDVRDLSRRFAVDVISSCAFGINSQSLVNENAEIKTKAERLLNMTGFKRSFAVFAWLFCPLLVDIFRLTFFDKESSQYLANIFKHSYEERKRLNVKRNDLVDLLNGLKESETKNDYYKLDEHRMSALALTFFNAGGDGSSSLLSLCLYEIAINPEEQETLRAEIRLHSDSEGLLSYKSLFEMEYLDLVIKETLRKYPFVQFLARYAEKEYTFEETGLQIEKGTRVWVPLLALHYDKKYFPNPHKFDPERFRQNKIKDLQYVYLPFGDGPRKCIGDRFALMSTKVGLTTFLKDFEIKPGMKTDIPLKFSKAATLNTTENGKIFLKIVKLK